MKRAVIELSKMNSGFEAGAGSPSQEPPPMERRLAHTLFNTRPHSRSASWSFAGSQRPSPADIGSSLAAMNPIRSVIREFVPSLNPTDEHNTGSPSRGGISRTSSQLSAALGIGQWDSAAWDSSPQTIGVSSLPPSNNVTMHIGGNESCSSTESVVGGGGSHVDDSRSSVGSSNDREQPRPDNGGAGSLFDGHGSIGAPMGEQLGEEPTGGGAEISDGVRWAEQNVLFLILLVLRYFWMHRSGLLVIIGMLATYLHCNHTIKAQVALKNRRDIKILLIVILFLGGNIYFFYFVFQDENLHKCLIFMSPLLFLDLWNLFWCICLTDFIVRFGTMILKALVAACFLCVLPSRKKGKYYMLLESISQFYRTLLPTPLWFGFFSNYLDTGAFFAIIVTAVYLMIKGVVILSRGKDLLRSIIAFIQDQSYGSTPSKDEMLEGSYDACPICQEDFTDPIKLRCRHIFCENCVLQWFDRERTCPLCRASIADDPKWRDGSTAAWPQIF